MCVHTIQKSRHMYMYMYYVGLYNNNKDTKASNSKKKGFKKSLQFV